MPLFTGSAVHIRSWLSSLTPFVEAHLRLPPPTGIPCGQGRHPPRGLWAYWPWSSLWRLSEWPAQSHHHQHHDVTADPCTSKKQAGFILKYIRCPQITRASDIAHSFVMNSPPRASFGERTFPSVASFPPGSCPALCQMVITSRLLATTTKTYRALCAA
jgi:hypothetical protein